ncbi:MAG: hypothetical protein ACKVK5_12425, partial [Pseudomonadales bacterium]
IWPVFQTFPNVSYNDAWRVFKNPEIYFCGKPEINGGAAEVYDGDGRYMPSVWGDLVATNRWLGRAGTPLSQLLYDSINSVLDESFRQLSKHPARSAYSHKNDKYNSKFLRRVFKLQYPLQWTLFGDLFHPLNYKYRSHFSRELPFDLVENLGFNYR